LRLSVVRIEIKAAQATQNICKAFRENTVSDRTQYKIDSKSFL